MDPDLRLLLDHLPPRFADGLRAAGSDAVELALDIGRPPVLRFTHGFRVIDSTPIAPTELDAIVDRVGTFRRDNRAGISGTLHRLSLIRDRFGDAAGMTVRIGRHLTGVADVIADLLLDRTGSWLLIGPPGAGKTTLLRDVARVLSQHLGPAVIVVDSHNEIGGDGTLAHPAIGSARRLQVPDAGSQYDTLLEAVRNHFPEVVIIDEISHKDEVEAARTIARRGVRLIATAHGETLADVVDNPELCWLVGGAAATALSTPDRPARRRVEPPTMAMALDVRKSRTVAIYKDVARAVDTILGAGVIEPDEVRDLDLAMQQRPPAPPRLSRVDEAIPETDAWAFTAEGVG